MRDGKPMRLFPIGARGDVHVALTVVEDFMSGAKLEVYLAAPEGVAGTVVLDIGLVEVRLPGSRGTGLETRRKHLRSILLIA